MRGARGGLRQELEGLSAEVRAELLRRIEALTQTKKADEAALARLPRAFEALPDVARTAIALVATRSYMTRGDLAILVHLRHADAGRDDAALQREVSASLSAWPITASGPDAAHPVQMLPSVAEALGDAARRALAIPYTTRAAPVAPAGVASSLLSFALTPGLLLHRDARLTVQGALHAAAASKLARVVPSIESFTALWLELGGIDRAENGAVLVRAARAFAAVEKPVVVLPHLLGATRGWQAQLLAVAARAPRGASLDLAAALTTTTHVHEAVHALNELGRGRHMIGGADVERNRLMLPPDVAALMAGEVLAADDKSWVQPDFEIVLSPGVGLVDAFIAGCAAELHHLDRVARLRLTQRSVRTAASLGIDSERVASALERLAQRPLPPAVRTALREWGTVGSGRVHEVIALEASGPPALLDRAEEILAGASLRRAGEVFILSRAPTAKEVEALRSAGLFVEIAVDRHRVRERAYQEEQRLHERHRDVLSDLEHRISRGASRVEIIEGEPRAIDARGLVQPERLRNVMSLARGAAAPAHHAGPMDVFEDELENYEDDDLEDYEDDDPELDALEDAIDACADRWRGRPDWVSELQQMVARSDVQYALSAVPEAFIEPFTTAQSPAVLRLQVTERVAQMLAVSAPPPARSRRR